MEQRIRTSRYPVSHLGDKTLISKLVDGPFGTQIKVSDYRTAGIPLLRVSNCRENEVSDDNLVYIEPELHARLLRSEVRPGDVVLTKTGHVLGYAAVFPNRHERANISSHLVLMRTTKRLLPEFLAAYLRTDAGQDQVYRWGQKATKPELNTIEIRQFLLPVPDSTEQLELLAALGIARAARREKLAQADALLSGLDAYVLETLGLEMPSLDSNTMYAIGVRDLRSRRWDAHFYTPRLRKLEAAIRHLPCQTVSLGTLLREPPLNGLDAREFTDTGRRYLRVQNVRPFDLSFDDVKHVVVKTNKDIALAAGDVLLTRKGTYGVAAVVPSTATDCLISSEIMLLRRGRDTRVSTDFLVAWINCSAGQGLLYRYKSGGIMGHLTQDVVEAVLVPVPDTKVQETISAEVSRRRDEARRLRDEARILWDEARHNFEKELLGPEPSVEEPTASDAKGRRRQ